MYQTIHRIVSNNGRCGVTVSGAALNWFADTGACAVLAQPMEHDPDPHGQAALMLCECMLILMIEEGYLPKARLLEVIADVIDMKREIAGRTESVVVGIASIGLLRAVAQSLAAVTVATCRRLPSSGLVLANSADFCSD